MTNLTLAPKLLAIIAVSPSERVRCAQPGCNHTVYKAVHIVREGAQLMVLGSTCFAKRYGSANALGSPQHGGTSGRMLTAEERALLDSNTEALLQRFAEQEAREKQLVAERLNALKALKGRLSSPPPRPAPPPSLRSSYTGPVAPRKTAPWPWASGASIAAFLLRDGTGWVRVGHRDGRQCIAPWPAFDGWDETLPPSVGLADLQLGAYVVSDVVSAIAYLRARAAKEKITGIWSEAAAILATAGAAPD